MTSNIESFIQKSLVLVAFSVFATSFAIAYLNQTDIPNLFVSSNEALGEKYYQEVSPSGKGFSIVTVVWPSIYIWNTVSIVYIVVSLCLSKDKSPVQVQPTLIPISFLLCHILGFGSLLGWLFVFDREILLLAFFLLLLAAAAIYGAFAISCKRVHDNVIHFDTKERRVMLWLVRIFIQNGLGLPAAWLTVATCLLLSDVIIYQDSFGLDQAVTRVSGDTVAQQTSIINASTGVLALLFVIIIVWFVLDTFVLEQYTRYTFTVYPVFILGWSGLIARLRYRSLLGSNQNLIFASVILGFTVAFFLIRIGLSVYRYKQRRRESTRVSAIPMHGTGIKTQAL